METGTSSMDLIMGIQLIELELQDSSSRFEELEMMIPQMDTGNKNVISAFREQNTANMKLGEKVDEKMLTVTANLREYCRLEGKLGNPITKKNVVEENVEDNITKAIKEPMVPSKTAHHIMDRVVLQFDSLTMQVFGRILT